MSTARRHSHYYAWEVMLRTEGDGRKPAYSAEYQINSISAMHLQQRSTGEMTGKHNLLISNLCLTGA
jgi:hypothetical protein